MSVAHIEQFYSIASKDPQLVARMMVGTQCPDDFIRNAVQEAKASGYDFTFEEADAWIKKQQQLKANGELSDSQLEGVAGGKGSAAGFFNDVGKGLGDSFSSAGNAMWNWAKPSIEPFGVIGTKDFWSGVGKGAKDWWSSW